MIELVKLSEMMIEERQRLVSEITWIMRHSYHIDEEDIESFWNTLAIGTEVQEKA